MEHFLEESKFKNHQRFFILGIKMMAFGHYSAYLSYYLTRFIILLWSGKNKIKTLPVAPQLLACTQGDQDLVVMLAVYSRHLQLFFNS